MQSPPPFVHGRILDESESRPASQKEWGMYQAATAMQFLSAMESLSSKNDTERFLYWTRHYAQAYRELCGGSAGIPINLAPNFLPHVLHDPQLQKNIYKHEFFINKAVNAGALASEAVIARLERYLLGQREWGKELLQGFGCSGRQGFVAETGGALAATKKTVEERLPGVYIVDFRFPHVNAKDLDSNPLRFLLDTRKNLVQCIATPESISATVTVETVRKVA